MQYRLPTLADEAALTEYVREHHACGESSVSASLGLPVMPYADWLQKIHLNATSGDPEWGKSLLYICLANDRIVGLLSIRYELSEALTAKYGHIGYGVRPSERGKGYATQMLRHALSVCRGLGMASVVLGCYKANAASAAVIQKCGGTLFAENDNYTPGKLSQYYTIDLQ